MPQPIFANFSKEFIYFYDRHLQSFDPNPYTQPVWLRRTRNFLPQEIFVIFQELGDWNYRAVWGRTDFLLVFPNSLFLLYPHPYTVFQVVTQQLCRNPAAITSTLQPSPSTTTTASSKNFPQFRFPSCPYLFYPSPNKTPSSVTISAWFHPQLILLIGLQGLSYTIVGVKRRCSFRFPHLRSFGGLGDEVGEGYWMIAMANSPDNQMSTIFVSRIDNGMNYGESSSFPVRRQAEVPDPFIQYCTQWDSGCISHYRRIEQNKSKSGAAIHSGCLVFICLIIFFISVGYILPINKARSIALLPYQKVPSNSDNQIPCLLSSGCFVFKWFFNCCRSLQDFFQQYMQQWTGHFSFFVLVWSSYYFFILNTSIRTVTLSYYFIYSGLIPKY